MLAGLALAVLTYLVSFKLMAWMAPVLVGLCLSVLLSWWTARVAGPFLSRCLAIREDYDPPPILELARARAAAWAEYDSETANEDAKQIRPPAIVYDLPAHAAGRSLNGRGTEELSQEIAHAHR